ncbi:MAG TPA: SRPBCC domain-containing protein [Cytophagales bacterium]|nr:SRPBCC domain-containing protein [Cytophagales bacterium]
MKSLVIQKTIAINATKEQVWDILVQDQHTRAWYAAFSEGTHAVTDWSVGSTVKYIDGSNSGMIAKVVVNRPGEELSVEFQGEVIDGKEVYDSPGAQAIKGGKETYKLSVNEGTTVLYIESDMTEEYFDIMSKSWDKALQIIKELAEKPNISSN